jgi:hypothetical protein
VLVTSAGRPAKCKLMGNKKQQEDMMTWSVCQKPSRTTTATENKMNTKENNTQT